MHPRPDAITLHSKNTSLVLQCCKRVPELVYWGKKISEKTSVAMLATLREQHNCAGGPAQPAPLSLTPLLGQGYTAHPGLCLHSEDNINPVWSTAPEVREIISNQANACTIISEDITRQITLVHKLELDQNTDVLTLSTTITNKRSTSMTVDWCAAAALPLPSHINNIMGFEGRWSQEFQTHRLCQHHGAYVRENRRGRTSHDSFPGLILHEEHTNENQGEAYGFHLGWSGNHRLMAEKNVNGQTVVQLGELLLPGEITLLPGETYQSPVLYASFSHHGFTTLSQQFHEYVRNNILRPTTAQKPRPVHYNTWEAIYFNHDLDTLKTLANLAAEIGVERFVLDDGWFPGRNNDQAGLGDWQIDTEKYPEGLAPLIQHINQLDMSFGLWFEPEMVNPDSELFRQHPDWVLSTPPNPQVNFRHQYVLDLTRPEVFDYLFTRIHTLLSELNIEYIKWDMNRDLNHPGDAQGKPAVHRQTQSVYALLEKIRRAHPSVEIESCASGGGRADYGILAHTDRIWTSDNNDALERLKIQKGFSYFFPAELMGSHVGPRDCHITHRHLPMALRAAVTLFGHMGMEMDLRELTDSEKLELKALVSLYKKHRRLVHTGHLYRLDHGEHSSAFGIVSKNKSEALFSYTLLKSTTSTFPKTYRMNGLHPTSNYKLEIIWPTHTGDKWPASSLFGIKTNLDQLNGQIFSGESLMQLGLQLPMLTPQSNLIFYLEAQR